jgi:tetratricopeptide (TPR) repeat protein
MGKFDLAKADCDTVLAEDPKHPLALQNRALLALGEKDFQKAVSLFSSLPDDVLFDETISIGFIRSCLGGNKPDLAISFIGRAKEHNPLSDYIFLEAWAHIQNGDLTSALKLREAVLSRPENFKSYEIAGYIDQQLNNYEEALSNFETAYNLCPDENQKCFLALQLAQIYYNAHRYTESVDWFDKSKMDLSIDLVLAKLYVGALYWAKNYEKAILFARSVRESGVLDKNLLQIESSISEFLGNLTEALDLTRETILIDPGDLHHKMNCARLLFRLNKIEEALSILNNINVDGLTPIELMMTAEMYSFVGSAEKAISMGYLAYSRGKDSADLHMAYLGLFLRLEKSLVLDSLTIEADTAILLEADNEQRWIKILSTIKPNEANWEYATESQQAKLLLGHRVGDLIPYKDSPLEKILYTVKEIQSVYVRAFQEIFLEFGPRFPDDSSLQKIQFKDDDVTPFLSSVAKMGVFSDQVFDLYKTGVLSSEQFARFSGRSKIPTMRALQITKDISVFASQGTHQEQWEQNKLASESIDLTVSISALLTLQLLGIQDNFVRRFKNIYIHQRLLDEIDHALLDARHERVSGKSTVGYHNGQFFWNETSEVFLVDEIENLEALQRLMKDHCQVVALKPEFADALLNIQDIAANPVGELSLVSIMMAKQMQTPLYSDDLVVSLYAKSKYDVSAFWTQPLLIEMLSKDQIDFSAYCNLCCRLLEAGYVYTSTNDQMILQIIQEDKFTSSGRLNVVLLGLRQPTIEGFAIEIAVKVIRSIWMGFATSEQRRFILDKILYNLTIGRRLDRVLIQVMRKVNREFSLAPIQLPDIQNEIRLWHNVHASPNKNRLWFP